MNVHRIFIQIKYIIFLCLFCFNSVKLFAQELSLNPLPGVEKVPEYLIEGNGQSYLGFSTHYLGRPVIIYDNVWVQRIGGLESPGFRFTRAHEYAHITRGHLNNPTAPSQDLPNDEYEKELDADCAAVRYLKEVGDLIAIQAGVQIYRAVLTSEDKDNRPGAIVRLNNMQNC